MKKLLVLITCLLVLVGCSNKPQTSVTGADEALFEVAGQKYTKGQLYDEMMVLGGSDAALSALKLKLAEKDGADLDSLYKDAEDEYDMYVQMYGEDALGSKDSLIKNYVSYYIDDKIVENYVNKDITSFVDEYKPFRAQVVYFDNDEAAKELVKKVNEGSTFDMAAAELQCSGNPGLQVYSANDMTLNAQVNEYCQTGKLGISDVIVSMATTTDADGNSINTPRYYIVNIESFNYSDFKDEFVDYLISNAYVSSDTALKDLLANHKVNIYVQSIYDSLSAQYPELEIK